MPTLGRPPALTPPRVEALLAALRDGLPIDAACDVAGVSRSTFYAAQAKARNEPKAHPSLTDLMNRVAAARHERLHKAHRIVSASLAEDMPPEVRRATAFRVIDFAMRAEAMELRRIQVEQGQRIIHSGHVGVALTPERRRELDHLRRDEEFGLAAVRLASMRQPARLDPSLLPSIEAKPEYEQTLALLKEREAALLETMPKEPL